MALLRRIQDALAPETVHAHCDIPCGIYDPHDAQVAAHTVVRMMDLIHEVQSKDGSDLEKRNSLVRYVQTKETHAEKVKHEVRIIWGDYFKPEHVEKFPDLHETVWKIMKLGSQCRQTIDKKAAEELLAETNRFAEMFWKTKDKDTTTATAPYPTAKPLTVPNLK